MKRHQYFLIIALTLCGVLFSCNSKEQDTARCSYEELYAVFQNPEAKYRPFVRWWWNGDRLDAREIVRELDLMKDAGIGGVEINPIRFPETADSIGIPSIEWLSPAWIDMLKAAVDACKEKGMVCDMIVGSGWPFGSEYLPRELQLQLLTVETIDIPAGSHLSMPREEILSRVNPQIMSPYENPEKELKYLRLMPKRITEFTPGECLDDIVEDEQIELDAPDDQDYVLYCFVKITGFMAVINGAPGAKGPVLNHFDREAVNFFLSRVSDAVTPVLGQMGTGLRAAFCDSFETEGSNWDESMREQFERRRGYDISPYLPYIIPKIGHMGNPVKEKYGSYIVYDAEFADLVERVRNDYEKTQIDVFRDEFLVPYIEWCHSNGMKSRIQAYGRGLHPLESSMMLDIPENESWFNSSVGRSLPENSYQNRGYSMINKFVTSASLLSGNNIVSCEEQTNTGFVFRSTMEQIKVTGDMSNLSGVNSSVLHGFNYSPKETIFPGWVRYGTYFNEKNSWWPHIRLWMDYKARLSALFQNTEMQSDIAVLPPLEDMWSKIGAQRDPFPENMYPEYSHNLWEAIHQSGCNCDYVSEAIIEASRIRDGKLQYHGRSYSTILLMEVESLSVQAAKTLHRFVDAGGKVICIGKTPHKSHGLADAEKNDANVLRNITNASHTSRGVFATVEAPSGRPVLDWYLDVREKYQLNRSVVISSPVKYFSQNHYAEGQRDLFFFVNYNMTESYAMELRFPNVPSDRTAWIWNPETGERYRLGEWKDGLKLDFEPASSMVLVFDKDTEGPEYVPNSAKGECARVLDSDWKASFAHCETGEQFCISPFKLSDLSQEKNPRLNSFAGTVSYETQFETDDPSSLKFLDAGETNGAVVELIVNGQSVGTKWYGNRIFDVSGKMKQGQNDICLRLTTTLGNYVRSLRDNPVAMTWCGNSPSDPSGLEGPVALYKD